MANQNEIFGTLTRARLVRRVDSVCTDRADRETLTRLTARPDANPFGRLTLVRDVTRH